MADKIFYLTAKTITRTVALETFQLLGKQHLQFKTIALMAKEKICFCEEVQCNPEACVYARGHFDRINDCVFSLLASENMITTEVIRRYAREYRVCPFELSLDVAVWVDAVVCDYNYVFDYAAPETKALGEKLIAEELTKIPNETVRKKAAEYIQNIQDGERDFRF